ncbi:hypothetical protein AHF37_01166 [Paragonimus kellicotti]|nr:hypothetical protein AHF37_01166 [Paragonimus kellicotti]
MGHRYSPCTCIIRCCRLVCHLNYSRNSRAVEQVISDTTCRIEGPQKPSMRSFKVHFNRAKPVTRNMTKFLSSSTTATNTETPEPNMHAQISNKVETSIEFTSLDDENNRILTEEEDAAT